MKSQESRKSGLSESFVMGVIAIVFLLVGYQTALFIHRAAVTRIVSNRDVPDTVYVCREIVYAEQETPHATPPVRQHETKVRKNSQHSERSEAVRKNIPVFKVESFAFNPNTVSVDDLCRLGFTRKQAESIDNYRAKGGVFHRKEDFAKSYVVADSIYQRLEQYIEIPLLDLNTADAVALDDLPGVGEWYANRIVEYRNELHGYSFKEQLMDIYRFDRQKFDALSDLVTVSRPYKYPLWTLSADSLRRHPYIRDMETARSIVLFRDNNPHDLWKVENLCSAGILSKADAERLGRCVL
jgi:DNA uptake protein ComE-like DNA-binding protein